MSTQQNVLSVANHNKTPGLPFELNELSVSSWLEGLPITDKIETCKIVFSTLKKLNQHSFDSRARFEILEIFRCVVFIESAHLESHFNEASFPLEKKTRKIAKLAAKFHSELASGYQLITNAADFEDGFSHQEQATIVQRIFHSIGVSILRIAQMYEPPSSKVWALLKKIYVDAESKRLLDTQIQDPLTSFPNSVTVASTFSKVILFTVCNPYRYSQKEMTHLFKLCEENSHNIEWEINQTGSSFGFDLDNATAPQHISSLTEIKNKTLRGIDTSKFITALFDRETRSALNETTLESLKHHLGNPKEVKINSLGIDAEFTLGLEKIISILQVKTAKSTAKNVERSADWLSTPNFELLPLTDHQSSAGVSGNETTGLFASNHGLTKTHPEKIWANSKQYDIGSNVINCEVHRSDLPGHLLIELKFDNLTVGQLVALNDNRSPLQIGVIRWVQPATNNHYFYYGIEKLTSKCSLVNIFIASKKHTNVLLLERNASGFASNSIVMAPEKYRSGTRLTVKQPQLTKNFILEKLLETSTFFCHYSLKEISSVSPRPS